MELVRRQSSSTCSFRVAAKFVLEEKDPLKASACSNHVSKSTERGF